MDSVIDSDVVVDNVVDGVATLSNPPLLERPLGVEEKLANLGTNFRRSVWSSHCVGLGLNIAIMFRFWIAIDLSQNYSLQRWLHSWFVHL